MKLEKKIIIVTADDYGISIGVNDAIEAGINTGLITSTNVMTNMEYYHDASKLRDMKASVGLHWTLSAGKPVCEASKIPSLVNKDGAFYSYPEFRKRYRDNLISNDDIKTELLAQYDRFVEVCGEPDYWNTHQNVHVDFKIYKLFVSIAAELNIKKMRSHQRKYVPSSNGKSSLSLKWRMLEPLKASLLNKWQNNAHKAGIKSPNGLVVCLNEEDCLNPFYALKNLKCNANDIVEYVIHPSTKNDSAYFGKITDKRILEYQLFSDSTLLEKLNSQNIVLVNYDNI